ncbi:MAG: hypothetical protein KG003_10490 [Bacteroidetes bacterium]|nr:hypothetical protein [Bacteroidota bacterium]
MNFFEDLLFTQYYELRSKGKSTASAKNTGILLLSVLILLVLITIFMVINAFGILNNISTPWNGKYIGKLLGIVFLALCFGAIYLFYGNPVKYDKIIQKYEQYSEEEQNLIYKTGMKKFLILFSVLLMLIVVFAFF